MNQQLNSLKIKYWTYLKQGEYAVKDIIKKLQLTWSEKKLREYLKSKKEE
jgi:hypothetical protein